MVYVYMLDKVLGKIKQIIATKKFQILGKIKQIIATKKFPNTNILIETDDKLPVYITLKML